MILGGFVGGVARPAFGSPPGNVAGPGPVTAAGVAEVVESSAIAWRGGRTCLPIIPPTLYI